MGNFRRISDRLLFVVGIVVAVGLTALAMLYATRQGAAIHEQNERALLKVTGGVGQALQSMMLRGYADIAADYKDRLKAIPDIIDFRIMRTDGREAFVDNATIRAVNATRGESKFDLRANAPAEAPQVMPASDPQFRQVLAEGKPVIAYHDLPAGGRTVTVLQPVLGAEGDAGCRRCHGDGSELRAVVKLTTSLDAVEVDVRQSWWLALAVMLVGAAGIAGAVRVIAQRAVAQPIARVTRAMTRAARGDLSVKVPVTGRDEIGRMAESFNLMSRELLAMVAGLQDEQDKLTTIIRSAGEGIVVTDPAGQVVLVNRAMVGLLGKSEADIVRGGFIDLVDDPHWMATQLNARPDFGVQAGLIERGGRLLSVTASTIRGGDGAPIGSAAIVRDVTDEQRRERELKQRSITDALTGLYNRRHFDEQLAHDYARWLRYRSAFALVLLDIDHFKRFNDEHGHECGDRVLLAIGSLLKNLPDPLAIACRYGGEELALILPGADRDHALMQAESVRRSIAALDVDGLQVTASFGVAACPPLAPASAPALLKAADAALYRAKRAGRNRVEAATNDD